ncbi:poly [ADP-ribose] polymerase 12-like isoform X2 [Stylophora pistillata]|uniref:poly [ADP-ribose] polymerase 12-like isoform X2 n=1 Tax=Stylophora pistillata TaxID=50429 RepID=UPI000C03E5F1|nr:poly [ADP-ribose] polymerase 12-like isoform X2 [Stylophora pistillata]
MLICFQDFGRPRLIRTGSWNKMPAPGVIIGGILATIATFTLGAFVGSEIGTQNSHRGNSSQNRRRSDTGTRNSGNSSQNQSDSGNRGATSPPEATSTPNWNGGSFQFQENGSSTLYWNGGSTSYGWQFQEEGSPSHLWNDFGPSDNAALEELYCDVENSEVEVYLKDTASRHKKLFSEGVSVDFEQMMMISHSSKQFFLHRHSEPSYVQVPDSSSSTRWVWYWEDNDGWKKYSETKESSVIKQEEIEVAFLDGAAIYPFQIGLYKYVITFDDKPMCQINMKYGTIRRVRRRPLFTDRDFARNLAPGGNLDRKRFS